MAEKNDHIIDEMTSAFVSEIKDDLAALEPDLLKMEEEGANVDKELVNHAFRAIHSIKGGAGFIQFSALTRLAHAMENVFMHVRDEKLVITPDIVDCLLAGFDRMKAMVDGIHTHTTVEFESHQAALENILTKIPDEAPDMPGSNGSSGSPGSKGLTGQGMKKESAELCVKAGAFGDLFFEVDLDCLEQALAEHKFLFAIHVDPGADLSEKNRTFSDILEDIGQIGSLLFPVDGTEEMTRKTDAMEPVHVIISTILDRVFLAKVLDIDEDRIFSIDAAGATKNTSGSPASVEKTALNLPGPDRPGMDDPADDLPPCADQSRDTVRIHVDLISRLMNRAGELVLARNQLKPFFEACQQKNTGLDTMLQNFDLVTTDIQEAVMQMRMQPVRELLGKYRRVVRDIARKLDKEVSYTYTGGNVELDRNVIETLGNPFVHLIRNCVDHGIETIEERRMAGKPQAGQIRIQAFHQGGQVHIMISDDGAGIHPDVIASKAVEKKLVPQSRMDEMSDREKINLVFMPGFSISDNITDISGRGVGMDVVKTSVEKLGGRIDLESTPGKGTTIRLAIPLTLAIVSALIIRCSNLRFAVPRVSIREVLWIEPGQTGRMVENIGEAEVLRVRDKLVPVVRLRNILDIEAFVTRPDNGDTIIERRRRIADRRGGTGQPDLETEKRSSGKDRRQTSWDSGYVLMLKNGESVFALFVDDVYEIDEIVVEPLSLPIKHCHWFSGATILGDGQIAMILDALGLAAAAKLRFEEADPLLSRVSKEHEVCEAETGLLVFTNAADEYFAVDLTRISRIEPVSLKAIQRSGEKKWVQHDNALIPVFFLQELMAASPFDQKVSEACMIVPKSGELKTGILASGIHDIIYTGRPVDHDGTQSGIARRMIEGGMALQILDMNQLNQLMAQRAG